MRKASMTSLDDSPLPAAMVLSKDSHRQGSRGSDDSSSLGLPANPVYGQPNSQCSVSKGDVPTRDIPISGDFFTESGGIPELQYVILDDDNEDESLNDEESEPRSSEANSGDGSGVPSDGNCLSCSMCDRVFSSQQRLMIHVNKHMGVKPFACPLCPANFNTQASFQRHRRSHKATVANIQTHTCNLCNAQFSHVQHLTAHMKIHAEKSRRCPHCGIYIGGIRSLQKHIREEHPFMMKIGKKSRTQELPGKDTLLLNSKKPLTLPVGSGCKPVSCRLCGRGFATSRALQGHMKGHSRLYQWNPRKCQCGLLLADEAEYQRHLKSTSCSLLGSTDQGISRLDSTQSLSPLSPGGLSQIAGSQFPRQINPRSKSLDSPLSSSVLPLPPNHMTLFRASTEPALSQLTPSPSILNDVPSKVLDDQQDRTRSFSSESSCKAVSTSVPSDHHALSGVTIKSEGWSDAQTCCNSTGSDEMASDSTQPESQPGTADMPTPVAFRKHVRDSTSTRQPDDERPAMSSHYNREGIGQGGQQVYHVDHSEGAICRSSTEGASRDMEPEMPLPRSNTESPNTQITSSQSSHSYAPPVVHVDPTLMSVGAQEGVPWRCSYCGITFEDSLMYVIHKGCHEPGSPFRCSMCGAQCSDKVNFMLHFVRGQHTKPTHV